jgi:hypothetical protein
MVMEGVKKLSGSLGAEILGMNLENDLSESMLTDIKGYLNEYEVIFFRDQDISWDTHKKLLTFLVLRKPIQPMIVPMVILRSLFLRALQKNQPLSRNGTLT